MRRQVGAGAPVESYDLARRIAWRVVVALGLLAAGCGHAADAVDCQVQNHSRDWFDGSSYDACMSRQQREQRAVEQQERDRKACASGNAAACYQAGMRDREMHEHRAVQELEAACRADIGGACWQAGSLLRGDWLTGGRGRALTFLSRACVLGVAEGCAEAAEMDSDDTARADFAERACLLGARAACARAGDARMASDRGRARGLYEIGCDAGQHDACVGLGRVDAGAQ